MKFARAAIVPVALLLALSVDARPVVSSSDRSLIGWHGETHNSESHSATLHQTECRGESHTEYEGDVVVPGPSNLQDSAEDCCSSCAEHVDCNTWVYCPLLEGCHGRPHRECWLKHNDDVAKATLRSVGFNTPWVSGLIKEKRERQISVVPTNNRPRVFFDVEIDGEFQGRITFELFSDHSPLAAENFRALCTGEKGVVPNGREGAGKDYSFKGRNFYRIIDRFIDQSGAQTESIYGGMFPDDEGGLKLKHNRKGLLSMANRGPNTNTSHFSIVVAPAPHLDGKYVIFGEVVDGMDIVDKINKLANPQKDTQPLGKAIIVNSGQL